MNLIITATRTTLKIVNDIQSENFIFNQEILIYTTYDNLFLF